MVSSIRVRAVANGPQVEVQTLIQHPMDSGYLKDKAGVVIPPHFIHTVHFESAGKPVFTAYWGPAISKNPYLKFTFAGGGKGDNLQVRWIDNLGLTDAVDAKVI